MEDMRITFQQQGEEGHTSEDMRKKVMVAIDNTDSSTYALEWALSNLKTNIKTSGLVLFTAIYVDYSTIIAGSLGAVHTQLIVSVQEKHIKAADEMLAKAKSICEKHGFEAETAFEIGNPRETICEAVEEHNVDLLVIGSHGKGLIKRAFTGSVSNYCVNNAKCPVLVAKKPVS